MSEQVTYIIPDLQQGENIFDTYIMFIEAQRKRKTDVLYYDFLLNVIESLDRNLIDLTDDKRYSDDNKRELNEGTMRILKDWFPIMTFYQFSGDFVYALAYNLYGFGKTFGESWSGDEIKSLVSFFCPSIDYKTILHGKFIVDHNNPTTVHTSLSEILKAKNADIFASLEHVIPDEILNQLEFTNYKIFHRVDKHAFGVDYLDLLEFTVEELRRKSNETKLSKIIADYQYMLFEDSDIVWEIKISTDDDQPNAVQFLGAIYEIAAGIEASSENIEVKIIDWGNGSKWVKFRIAIKDFFAREDIKSVVEKGLKAASSQYLDAPIANVEKTYSEIEKLDRETTAIPASHISARMHEEDLKSKELSNIEKLIELESKQLDNIIKKLELIKTASEMVSSGIIKGDSSFEIEINYVLVFANQKQIPFTTINEIDERASLQPKDNDEPIS